MNDWTSPQMLAIYATVIVALITALAGKASNRAAAKASTMNTETTSRVDMEREAYIRARALDVETITRQDRELKELRTEKDALEARVDNLERDNRSVHAENRDLRRRIYRLESEYGITPKNEQKEQVTHERLHPEARRAGDEEPAVD